MSAIVLEDFVKPFVKGKLSERATNIIMRAVVLIFGVICVVLVFIVERLGTVLQVRIGEQNLNAELIVVPLFKNYFLNFS